MSSVKEKTPQPDAVPHGDRQGCAGQPPPLLQHRPKFCRHRRQKRGKKYRHGNQKSLVTDMILLPGIKKNKKIYQRQQEKFLVCFF
jgi:hypothetical protein